MDKLTTRQWIVLRALGRIRKDALPPSGVELSAVTGNRREWATPALVQLEAKGYAQRLGKSFGNSWCWQITPAGRSLLTRESENG